jgi:hypothetical protein
VAVFVSRVLQEIAKKFQSLPDIAGGPTQHERDMERRLRLR